jgi:hypothetical protein
MAWTKVLIRFDTDDPNTGTVEAQFTDTDGEIFTFSARVTRPGGAATFKAAAIAAKNAWSTTKANKETAETNLLTFLNS